MTSSVCLFIRLLVRAAVDDGCFVSALLIERANLSRMVDRAGDGDELVFGPRLAELLELIEAVVDDRDVAPGSR